MKIAIVTGASSGLGAEFVRQLDEREECDELWLVARRRDRLLDVAKEIKHARSRIFSVDLMRSEAIAEIDAALIAEKPQIVWLVNNAGFGKIGTFRETKPIHNLGMIDLNVRALTALTQVSLPYCTAGSRILQIASSAGFQPLPHMAVYAATKAFVVHFSDALHTELRAQGINVTAVCPGPVDTEFFQVAFDHETSLRVSIDTPSAVVRKAIRDSMRGNLHSFPSNKIRAMAYSGRVVSWKLLLNVMNRVLAPKNVEKWISKGETVESPVKFS